MQCTQKRDAVLEPLIESSLKLSLPLFIADVLPRLNRLPNKRQDNAARVRIIQPHLLRQERNVIKAHHVGFAQRPDLVVNGEEGADMFGIDFEHKNLDRQAFIRGIAKVSGLVTDRSF